MNESKMLYTMSVIRRQRFWILLLKVLIIADKEARMKPWFKVFETADLEIETAESVFEANDLFLTGLALGQSFPLVVFHHGQNSADARKLMVYWLVQEPSIAVLYVCVNRTDNKANLNEIGIIDTILEDEDPDILENHFRFLLQRARDRQVLGIKLQILEELTMLSDPSLALSRAISVIVKESSVYAAAFVRFTDKPDEPILQITKDLDITDQFWLDEMCDHPDETLANFMQDRRMIVDGERFLFPVFTSRGWEGLLVFIVKENSPVKTTDLESLAKTVHILLERVRVNEELEKKKSEKATYLSLLSDTMQTSLKESAQKIELLKMILQEKRALVLATKAENQVARTIYLLNDIVELARIDDGMMVLLSLPVNLQETIEKAIASIVPAANEAKIGIEFEGSNDQVISIDGDPKKLNQVFYNLLGFMVNNCDSEDTITVSCVETTKGHIFVKFSSKTSLHEKVDTKHLFDRPETTLLLDENNVSLFICKQFIQAHEGKIFVENNSLTGFSFIVQLRLLS